MRIVNADSSAAELDKSTCRGAGAAGGAVSRLVRHVLQAASLLPVFVAVYYLAYWLRIDRQLGPAELDRFASSVGCVVLIKLVLFSWFRIHQGLLRFITFYDLVALVQAATGSLLVTVLVDRLLLWPYTIPTSVFLLDWGGTIVVIGGIRGVVRVVHERRWKLVVPGNRVATFIVGANGEGESLLHAIISNGELTYDVVGFIDDDPEQLGNRIGGVPVVGAVEQTCRLAERYGVREVLIAAGRLSGKEVRKLVDEAEQHGIRVKVLPSHEQLAGTRAAIRPQPVSINDLLRREPVHLEMGSLRHWIDNRVVMVTGCAGSVGSEICRQLLAFSPQRIVLIDRSETGQFFLERELRELRPDAELEVCIADLLDEKRMERLFQQYQPQIIFHAAAYKHVPLMEAHPEEAVKNIVASTRRLADMAMRYDAESFVLISTDKAVNPTSVMGACKRAAELYVQSLTDVSACRFVTVRFGNVLDSAGSVVQVFRQQIAAGGPLTITDPRMQRYFMTIPEAARLVLQAGVIGNGGEILHLDMGEPISIVDLAGDMIRLSGLQVGKDITIEIIGLRPGEKLFEELAVEGESYLPTRHSKLVIADRKRYNPTAVLNAIERLEELADDFPDAIVGQLGRIVGEYLGPDADQQLLPGDASASLG